MAEIITKERLAEMRDDWNGGHVKFVGELLDAYDALRTALMATRENANYDYAITNAQASLIVSERDAFAAELEVATAKIGEIAAIANKHGWNGVDNPKILAVFIDNALEERAAAMYANSLFEQKRAATKADAEAFKAKLKEEQAKAEAREKAPGRKIYHVLAQQEAEFYVYADNEKAAEEIAEDHASDEIKDTFQTPNVSVTLVHHSQKNVPGEDSIPYGIVEDAEDQTVADILSDQLVAEEEAAEKARIEANQLKLFEVKP